jgi:hypothetical protein
MQVETLGEALAADWRVHARCLGGTLEYTRRHQAELNLETLAWTRARNMSLSGLRERMMCPRCGNRRVNLIIDPKRKCVEGNTRRASPARGNW